jgi:hypothetical protein
MSYYSNYPPGCTEVPGDHDITADLKAWITTVLDSDEFVNELSNILSEISEPSIVYNKESLLFEISGVYEGEVNIDPRYEVGSDDVIEAICLPFDYNLDDFEVTK